jgi:hypothetical protein
MPIMQPLSSELYKCLAAQWALFLLPQWPPVENEKKTLLLLSLAFCFITMGVLAFAIYMGWQWIALVSLVLFTFSFMTGLSSVPWILVGELPTGKNRLGTRLLCTAVTILMHQLKKYVCFFYIS